MKNNNTKFLIAAIITTSGKEIFPLKRCINSILRSAKVADIKILIYIVTDNEKLRVDLLGINIDNFIYVSSHLGFSTKNNIGIQEILSFYTPDFFLIINDDAWLRSDFFNKFLGFCAYDIVNPIVYREDRISIDSFGVEYFLSGYAKNAHDLKTITQLATASCMLVKTRTLNKIYRNFGFYFNDLLYYYLEDVEFSIRALSVGAKVYKSEKMIAYHYGSLTSGKKSYFTMYQTYRNIIWVILMTWPTAIIMQQILNILVVQLWVLYISVLKFGPLLYLRILVDTIKNLRILLKYRRIIQQGYIKNFKFPEIFSELAFRTYHGHQIIIK